MMLKNTAYSLMLILFVSITMVCHAQDQLQKAELRKQQLEKTFNSVKDSIVLLENLIKKLKNEKLLNDNQYMIAILKESTIVKDDYEGKVIDNVKAGDTVKIFNWKYWDLLVEYHNGKYGYIGQFYLLKNDKLNEFLYSLEAKATQDRTKELEKESHQRNSLQKQAIEQQNQKRISDIKSKFGKYGSQIVQDIINKKIWIGMSSEMAVASWGEPERINKTVNADGVKEQWVYGRDYLYFKSGLLETFQVSR